MPKTSHPDGDHHGQVYPNGNGVEHMQRRYRLNSAIQDEREESMTRIKPSSRAGGINRGADPHGN